jgi:hypothetical protein
MTVSASGVLTNIAPHGFVVMTSETLGRGAGPTNLNMMDEAID